MRFSIIVISSFCSFFPLVMMILLFDAKSAFHSEASSGSLKGLQADIVNFCAVAFTFFIMIWMLFYFIGTLATEFEKLVEAHITTQVQIAETLVQQRNADDVIS